MNTNIHLSFSLPQITKAISCFLHRYHIIVFSCIVLGGLSIATFMLYQTTTSTQPSTQITSSGSFDQATMKKIEGLRSASDQSEPLTLPEGRTNPFE